LEKQAKRGPSGPLRRTVRDTGYPSGRTNAKTQVSTTDCPEEKQDRPSPRADRPASGADRPVGKNPKNPKVTGSEK
jgi:hypothetical protein